MATGADEGEPLQTAVIEDLTVGWSPFVPPHSTLWNPVNEVIFAQGPVFRNLDNLRWQDGVLQRRQSQRYFSSDFFSTFEQPPLNDSFDPLQEAIYWLLPIAQTPPVGAGTILRERTYQLVMITTSDIWKMQEDGTWVRLTPVYAGEGGGETVSVNPASTAVTGSIGNRFVSRGITKGQHIQLDTELHEIDSVNSETTLTLKSPHTTGANVDTEIIRTFASNEDPLQHIFAQIFNGDLFVAGSNIGGLGNAAIIKIPNIYTVSGPLVYNGDWTDVPFEPANYIMSGSTELEVPMAARGSVVANASEDLLSVNGLQLNQDGRVQVLTEEEPDRVSRFRYSSPADQQLWDTSPGGFTDIVAGGTRVTEGLGRLGRIFTVHYWDTIAIGQPTGQDDPPLAFDSSRAQLGAAYPRSIRTVGGREFFLGYDGSVWAFDGSSTQLITDAFRDDFRITPTFAVDFEVTAWLDILRQEYCFSLPGLAQATLSVEYPEGTSVGCVNWETGVARRETYRPDDTSSNQVRDQWWTGVSDEFLAFGGTAGADGSSRGTRAQATRLVGMQMFHPGQSAGGEWDDGEYIRYLMEWGYEDDSGFGASLAETLPLDFGFPGQYKTIERVILYTFRDPRLEVHGLGQIPTVPFTEDLFCSIEHPRRFAVTQSRTVNVNYDYPPGPIQNPGTQAVHFEFDQDQASESWVIKFGPVLQDRMLSSIEKVVIRFQVLGEDEAVVYRQEP